VEVIMSAKKGEERRKHTRYPHPTRVWIERSGGVGLEELRTVDLSAGGLQLELQEAPDVDSSLLIYFEVPLLPEPVRALCRVVRVQEIEDGKGYAVGAELTVVEGIAKEQLMRYLDEVFS
jgi:c-di-GMP-binding flagellar brake protein YcgR